MTRSFILAFLFVLQWTAAQSNLLEDSLYSSSLNSMSKFYIILPKDYEKNQERFPVMYLLHGLGGDYSNWIKLTNLVRYSDTYRMIIVCPDGKNGWYSNSVLKKDANYEEHIMKDILPGVEKKYRTIQSKFYRGVAGLSMGGYGAIKFGLKYPSTFIFAAGISPSIQFPSGLLDSAIVARWSRTSTTNLRELFGSQRTDSWNNDDIFSLVQRYEHASLPYFYLSTGSQDGIIELPGLTHDLANAFRTKNIAFEMHEMPGGHDWKFWDSEILIVLQRFSEKVGKR
ncbi:MAG: alpha/beta hydrolase [Bacteroidota bacterium]